MCIRDSASIRCIDFKGIAETNRTHLRFETRHTLSSISHKRNLLSWNQDVAASPREFHEADNNLTNSVALLATWQYFSFRHIRFSKVSSYQKLSQIILSYFSNASSFEQSKRGFQISGKLSSFAKITSKKIVRHFENDWSMKRRHTGSDQSTNVYPRDASSLLVYQHVFFTCSSRFQVYRESRDIYKSA